MLVPGQDGQAVDVLDRHHRLVEAALVPGFSRALLALYRVGIDVIAGESMLGRDQIRGNSLRHEIGGNRQRRIHRPGATGSADADPAHGFHPAADRHVVLARHDLRGSEIDGIEPGGAKPVDLNPRHAVAVARVKHGGAGNIAARLADRIDAAEHHVFDERSIEPVAVADRGKRLAGEIERGDFVQRPVGLAAAARGADVVINECIGHLLPPQRRASRLLSRSTKSGSRQAGPP